MTRTTKRGPVWPAIVAPPMYENPAPGWEDPRLPCFEAVFKAARAVGYSVGLHGSMKRDCDLIAVPWTEAAGSADQLINAICEAIDASPLGELEVKPHGRRAIILVPTGWVKNVDLSIMPLGETCPDCDPCHADVLLALANEGER